MREHLAQCFEEGEMVPFPSAQKLRRLKRHRMVKLERLHVYCTSRLPWFTKDDIFGDMVQCKSCKEWFHQMCEEIDNSVFWNVTNGSVKVVALISNVVPNYNLYGL